MPKILCQCGQILSYGDIPSPIEWRLISDVKFEQFVGAVDADEVYRATDTVLRCPQCDRLWVFWDGASVPVEYAPKGSEQFDPL